MTRDHTVILASNFVLYVLLVCQDINMPPKRKASVTGDYKLNRKTMTRLEKVTLAIDEGKVSASL